MDLPLLEVVAGEGDHNVLKGVGDAPAKETKRSQ